jgi:hypothetical protein
VKRRELIRHLERFDCVLAEEGAKHSKYVNLADPRRVTQYHATQRLPIYWRAKSVANSESLIQNRPV